MKIVVLGGGISTERDVSLSSSRMIYQALRDRGHQAVLLDVYLGYDCLLYTSCPIDVELFQRDKAFLFQTSHELVIQLIQYFSRQLFSFKIIKNIPLRLLPFGQPDKGKVSPA